MGRERPRGIRLVREPTAPHLLSAPPARTRAPLPLIVALAVFAAIIAAYVVVFVGMATQDQVPEERAFLAKHAITYPAGFESARALQP